jgi:hypothetical protein
MNEETIIEKNSVVAATNGSVENKQESNPWKYVTLGGMPGILLGAGLLYAGQTSAQALAQAEEVVASDGKSNGDEVTNGQSSQEYCDALSIVPDSLHVAQVSDSMSFSEAFAAARAEVGPGGVFYWHGGVYGTYYANEWDAMTAEDKQEFAELVQPEINANQVPTPTDAHPDIAVQDSQVVDDAEAQLAQQISENFDMGGDVHIVGYANYDDHLMVGYDLDNDGEADVAIIDVDGNFALSSDDVIVDTSGNAVTIGDLAGTDPTFMANMENPDVASDMPDYMNDANIDPLV